MTSPHWLTPQLHSKNKPPVASSHFFPSSSIHHTTVCLPASFHLSDFVLCSRLSSPHHLYSRHGATCTNLTGERSPCFIRSSVSSNISVSEMMKASNIRYFWHFPPSLAHTITLRAQSCHDNMMIGSNDWMAEVEMYMCFDLIATDCRDFDFHITDSCYYFSKRWTHLNSLESEAAFRVWYRRFRECLY